LAAPAVFPPVAVAVTIGVATTIPSAVTLILGGDRMDCQQSSDDN
jgi:hypothetical protein